MTVYNSIGKFKIKTILGGGGMGRVFLADNLAEGREVALKLVPADDDAAVAERWGALLTQQLDHPGVARVYSFGEVEQHFFVEMEYVAGRTLRRLLQDEGSQPVARACDLILQACHVLSAAHTYRGVVEGKALSGIIHGDLSWSNLLIQPDDRIKIIDFGVADALSATRSWKTVKGQTPNFAAPEQLKPGEMRIESDLWAVGVLLYTLLNNQLPFNRTAEKSTEERILHDRPVYPENAPLPLAAILSRLLQKSYAARYSNADELKADLIAFLEGHPIAAVTATQPSAFRVPGETLDLDEEQTQRTHCLPVDDQTIAPSDAVPTAILPAVEATQRTMPPPAPPPPVPGGDNGVRLGLPPLVMETPPRLPHGTPVRLHKVAIIALILLLVIGLAVFVYETHIIEEALAARERFESGADKPEETWKKYEALKERDRFKLGVVRLERALKAGLVRKGETALSRALDSELTPVKQDWQEAAYYFDYARRLPPEPSYSEARYNFASAMVAWSSHKKKDLARARELLLLAADQDRQWAYPSESLGRMSLEAANQSKSKNYDEALQYFSRAIEVNDRWAKPYEGRGWCYLKGLPPRLDEAIRDFEKAEQLGMNTKSLHLGAGMALQQRGQANSNVLLGEMDLMRAEKEYKQAGVEFKRENPVVRIFKRVFDIDEDKR